jgi:hypothetical protein
LRCTEPVGIVCATAARQTFWHQEVTHSFYRNGGWYPPPAAPKTKRPGGLLRGVDNYETFA